MVWTFYKAHLLDRLRYQEVQVRITLTMSMRPHIDGHPVEPRGEVSAMVEIEAAQKHLVGFSRSAVLRHD